MKTLAAVTVLVTSVLLSMAAEARPQRLSTVVSSPFSTTFKLQGLQSVGKKPEPSTYASLGLNYGFYKTYSLGVEGSFSQSARYLRTHAGQGWGDSSISLTDSNLWSYAPYGYTLSGSVGAVFGTGMASRMASLQYGAFQSLTLTQKLSDRFSWSLGTSVFEYSWEYDTAMDDESATIYNTQFRVVNRLAATYRVLRSLAWTSGSSLLTYHTTASETYTAWLLFTSMAYDVAKAATIDFGVRSGHKRNEDPITWSGPAASNEVLGADGIILFLGTTIKL
ncbi:MAG: hypothetical protein KF799_12170 [Bdellovibrionales bacterium]|nr:hypothetical protein [Bdellovibrionales bacterium]